MKITTVTFIAYNQSCKESFIDATPKEVHDMLMEICSTYIPTSVSEAVTTQEKFLPLSELDYPRPEQKAIPAHLQWAFNNNKSATA